MSLIARSRGFLLNLSRILNMFFMLIDMYLGLFFVFDNYDKVIANCKRY